MGIWGQGQLKRSWTGDIFSQGPVDVITELKSSSLQRESTAGCPGMAVASRIFPLPTLLIHPLSRLKSTGPEVPGPQREEIKSRGKPVSPQTIIFSSVIGFQHCFGNQTVSKTWIKCLYLLISTSLKDK